MFVAACSTADCVPVICEVQSFNVPEPFNKIPAAAAFSEPNNCANAAERSASEPSFAMPPDTFSSAALNPSVVKILPNSAVEVPNCVSTLSPSPDCLMSNPNTFLSATPASLPTLPPAAKTCIAAFVSSKPKFAPFAATPACKIASATCGISAAPTCADFARTLINRPLSLATSFASLTFTPNCSIDAVSASIAPFASKPPAFASIFMFFDTSPSWSGVSASCAPNFDNTP